MSVLALKTARREILPHWIVRVGRVRRASADRVRKKSHSVRWCASGTWYSPYGEVTATGSSDNPYQYTGRENDGTGLYYYRARYYSPTLKRFISEDPMGLAAGLDSYAYVGGNPLSRVDPLGLDFLGKKLAQKYLCKYGPQAWLQFPRDHTKPIIPGDDSEAERNAEHYLYAYMEVSNNSYQWGLMLAGSVGYQATKFWTNVADYYGILPSPWGYDIPTSDELESGFEGANDALYGDSSSKLCGCDEQ